MNGKDPLSPRPAEPKPPRLPQLDQARVRIVAKVAFRQRAQAHELNIVLPEKVKICGFGAVGAHSKRRHMRRNPPDFNS
jgi:hypothetical protein